MSKVEVLGLKLPLIEGRCDIVSEILRAAKESSVEILDHDIIVITDKILSKCFNRVAKVEDVKVSKKALKLAKKSGLNPVFVELVMRNSDNVVAVVPFKKFIKEGLIDLKSLSKDFESAEKLISEYPSFFITEREGMLWSDSGIDSSNLPAGYYSIPVEDHDLVAKMIRKEIYRVLRRRVAVVVCDTEAFLGGSMDFARGSYGIDPIDRCFACKDLHGKPKFGGVDIIVHEICSATALVFKQTSEAIPIAIVRGVKYRECECGFKDSIPKIDILKIFREVIRETIRVLGFKKLLKVLKMIIW